MTGITLCSTKDLPDRLVQELLQSPNPSLARKPRADDPHATRAAMLRGKQWPNGSVLRVGFCNGSPSDRDRVRRAAPEWSKYANIRFEFADAPDGDIRVEFNTAGVNNSAIGTDAAHGVPRQQPSLRLQFPHTVGDEEAFAGLVLHEFGHALGLIHEHQSPASPLEWDFQALRQQFGGPPNNWNDAMIQANIVDRFTVSTTNFTAFDPDSIMLYAFPASLTRNHFGTHQNTRLSQLDKQLIRAEYPGAPPADGDDRPPPAEEGPVELTIDGFARRVIVQAPGQRNLFTVDIPQRGKYRFEVRGDAEVVLSLFGPDSASDLVQKDGPNRRPSMRVDLDPGRYTAEVRHSPFADTGAYEIAVTS